jgi:hypothetical protein
VLSFDNISKLQIDCYVLKVNNGSFKPKCVEEYENVLDPTSYADEMNELDFVKL